MWESVTTFSCPFFDFVHLCVNINFFWAVGRRSVAIQAPLHLPARIPLLRVLRSCPPGAELAINIAYGIEPECVQSMDKKAHTACRVMLRRRKEQWRETVTA